MKTKVEIILSPAEWATLTPERLKESTCVVFDILRATSTIVTALNHGAESVVVVESIEAALDRKARTPSILLAGERGGHRICATETGSIDFDLGNSPREFTPERVRNRTIAMTTTNGTKAIHACGGASSILLGAMLNLSATAQAARGRREGSMFLICAGTGDQVSLEDVLGAGALLNSMDSSDYEMNSDGCLIARHLFRQADGQLERAFKQTRNGRRLSHDLQLREDIAYCARKDVMEKPIAVTMNVATLLK